MIAKNRLRSSIHLGSCREASTIFRSLAQKEDDLVSHRLKIHFFHLNVGCHTIIEGKKNPLPGVMCNRVCEPGYAPAVSLILAYIKVLDCLPGQPNTILAVKLLVNLYKGVINIVSVNSNITEVGTRGMFER